MNIVLVIRDVKVAGIFWQGEEGSHRPLTLLKEKDKKGHGRVSLPSLSPRSITSGLMGKTVPEAFYNTFSEF